MLKIFPNFISLEREGRYRVVTTGETGTVAEAVVLASPSSFNTVNGTEIPNLSKLFQNYYENSEIQWKAITSTMSVTFKDMTGSEVPIPLKMLKLYEIRPSKNWERLG